MGTKKSYSLIHVQHKEQMKKKETFGCEIKSSEELVMFLDSQFDGLVQIKSQSGEQEAESFTDRLEKLKKEIAAIDKECNEVIQKEMMDFIGYLLKYHKTGDVSSTVLRERIEEAKQKIKLKSNARETERKQYIRDVVSLLRDDYVNKDHEKELEENGQKIIGN